MFVSDMMMFFFIFVAKFKLKSPMLIQAKIRLVQNSKWNEKK